MKFDLLKVGTDAELFLRAQKGNIPVPVIGMLGGTKMEPLPVMNLEGFAVQEDNVMAEFNVPPASEARRFSRNIEIMLGFLRKKFASRHLKLAIEPSMHFKEEELKHPQAMTFGCDPDYCAWTDQQNEVARWDPILNTMRTAAAHIHVSYLVDNSPEFGYDPRRLAVRAHDLFVGVPGVLLDPDKDRRKIYGKAGAFRYTNYGHEYRTVSNFWIRNNKLRQWIFNQTLEALEFASSPKGQYALLENKEIGDMIQSCINGHDTDMAGWLCDEFSIEVPLATSA